MVDVDRCHLLEFWFPLDLENIEEILHIHELFKVAVYPLPPSLSGAGLHLYILEVLYMLTT